MILIRSFVLFLVQCDKNDKTVGTGPMEYSCLSERVWMFLEYSGDIISTVLPAYFKDVLQSE